MYINHKFVLGENVSAHVSVSKQIHPPHNPRAKDLSRQQFEQHLILEIFKYFRFFW